MHKKQSGSLAGYKKKLLIFGALLLLAAAITMGYIYNYVTPGTVVGNKPFYMPTRSLPICDYGGSLTGGPTDWEDLEYGAENMPCYIPKDATYF